MSEPGLYTRLGILHRTYLVLGKTYLTRQASLLLKFARTTSDADLSAKLISKAADLKSQADPMPDQGAKAPDVSPPEPPEN